MVRFGLLVQELYCREGRIVFVWGCNSLVHALTVDVPLPAAVDVTTAVATC